jgi:hypothetical protein
MCRKLLFLAIYIENIVALGMNQYSIKAFFFKYLNKVIRTIPKNLIQVPVEEFAEL